MGDSSEVGGNYWGYLINSNKSATPLLEQLCLGLARVIARLAHGPEDKLTPERMAAFYRSLGGHFDSLFLGSNENAAGAGSNFNTGLSFMYRTLGCYHSLEPTPNAFETPCVPCLTPAGFVRWQTIQILLFPDEHAGYLQKAVQMYEVRHPDGRLFGKSIPRDAFPEKPDIAMEKWHKEIESHLTQDYMHRLKNSPYSSPVPQPAERAEGYFGSRIPEIRRPSRTSRERSDEDRRRPNSSYSRRSSVPDFVSPHSTPTESARPPSAFSSRADKRRSVSAQRPSSGSRPRAATTGYSANDRTSSSSSQRDTRERPANGPVRNPPYSRHYSSARFQATCADDEDPSGEEASSEDSATERRRRRKDFGSSPRDEFRKRSLLLPIYDVFNHQRRHSSDGSALNKTDRPRAEKSRTARPSPAEASFRSPQAVHFKEDVFSDSNSASGYESSVPKSRFASSRKSDTFPRSPASNVNYGYPVKRDGSSGSGSERRTDQDPSRQRSGSRDVPLRVSTTTGVGGRRYANPDPKSPGLGPRPEPSSRDPRARYSVAV